MATMLISVVIPCFNEAASIAETNSRVVAAMAAANIARFEIVYVNDGSSDETLPLLVGLQKQDARVVVVDLSRNHGQQLALLAGLSVAKGERIMVIDADLQDPPELIGEMMTVLDQGADVAYGQRTSREGESLFKRLSARLFYKFIAGSSKIHLPVNTGDFRLMTRQVLDVVLSMPEAHRYLRGMVAWVGFRQVAVPYARAPRFAGESHYPLRRMLGLALDAITGFATTPLRFMYFVSLFAGLLAALILLWTLYVYVRGDSVPGWASLIGVFLVFTSIQMFAQGLMGEYVARIFMQTKQRPLFIIRNIFRDDKGGPT